MMNLRSFTFLFSLLFFLSANLYSATPAPVLPLPQTTITIVSIKNFSPQELSRIKNIISNLPRVINSNDFRVFVKENKIDNAYKFEENNNNTNEKIYNHIMSGTEKLSPAIDNNWQLTLNKRWLFSRSINAYTYDYIPEITFNSRYFKSVDDASIAGTICHEYSHKLGYKHDSPNQQKQQNSVPYSVGQMCSYLYELYFPIPSHQFNPSLKMVKEECGLICRFKSLFNVNN